MLRAPAAVVIVALLGAFALVHWPAALAPVFGKLGSTAKLFAAYLVAVPCHEWLHLLGYRLFGRVPRAAIRTEWHGVGALARCDAPMSVRAYRWAIALPGLTLGLAPLIVGFAINHAWLAAFGAFATGAAMADVGVLWALRGATAGSLVELRLDLGGYCLQSVSR